MERFDREMRALLAAARWSAADLEQVLTTAARIDLADGDSWMREWTAAGGTAWAQAQATGRADGFLHAATYYGAALALIDDSDGTVDEAALWLRQRDCWERALPALPGNQIAIPYGRTTLPGYLILGGAGRRPVIAIDPGGRMVASQGWVTVGAAAHADGAHVLIFDGPGGQASRQLGGLVARPDGGVVLEAVADLLLSRADVDGRRLAVVGLEFGAFGVAQGLRAEHRFAAAAVVPGIFDAAAPWLVRLPAEMRTGLLGGDRGAFDRELHLGSLFDPELQARLRHAVRRFDDGTLSLFDLYQRIRQFRLADVAVVRTPTLVCEPLEGTPWAGQAITLTRALGRAATFVDARGADDAIADWLARVCDGDAAAA